MPVGFATPTETFKGFNSLQNPVKIQCVRKGKNFKR